MIQKELVKIRQELDTQNEVYAKEKAERKEDHRRMSDNSNWQKFIFQ